MGRAETEWPVRPVTHTIPLYVTSVIQGRRPIFRDPELARRYLDILELTRADLGFEVYAYGVMPDHVHLIVRCRPEAPIGVAMQRINGRSARMINDARRWQGRVWQKRYNDYALRSPSDLRRKLDYVHANPVRAGLCGSPAEWIASSYRRLMGLTDDCPVALTREWLD